MNVDAMRIEWTRPRGRWQIGDPAVSRAELDALHRFFAAARGRAVGFRFSDWQRAQR